LVLGMKEKNPDKITVRLIVEKSCLAGHEVGKKEERNWEKKKDLQGWSSSNASKEESI